MFNSELEHLDLWALLLILIVQFSRGCLLLVLRRMLLFVVFIGRYRREGEGTYCSVLAKYDTTYLA